jgi:hypothetical protein
MKKAFPYSSFLQTISLCILFLIISSSIYAQKIYWIDYSYTTPKIIRVHPDGSNYRSMSLTTKTSPQGMVLNSISGNLLWDELIDSYSSINKSPISLQGTIDSAAYGLSFCRGMTIDQTNGKLYWVSSEANNNKIYASDLDGSNQRIVKSFGSGAFNLRDIVINPSAQMLYVTDYGQGKIIKVVVSDGTTTDLITGLSGLGPTGIALDIQHSKLYWTEINSGKIRRSDLTGALIEDIFTGRDRPQSITINTTYNAVYWTEAGNISHKVYTANLNSSGNIDNSSSKAITISGVSITNPGTIITGSNQPPVMANFTVTGSEDASQITINASQMTYTDADGDILQKIKIISLPSGGTLKYNGSNVTAGQIISYSGLGNFTFIPDANAFGNFTFQYEGTDGSDYSSLATVTITVSPVADTPTISSAETNEDIQTTSGLVISRNPADGAEVTHFKINNITNGRLFLNDGITEIVNGTFITFAQGNAGLKFTPASNFSGTANFTVNASTSASDAGLGGNQVTATITVNSVNDQPTLDAFTYPVIAYDGINDQTILLSGITAGGNESQALTITATSDNTELIANPAVNYTSPNSAATLSISPSSGKTGTAVITIRVTDNGTPAQSIERTCQVIVKKVPGNALVFNGTDQYAEVPFSAALNTSSFTIEFWAKINGGAGTNRSALSSQGNLTGAGFSASDINQWNFNLGNGSSFESLAGGNAEIGKWAHVAGTFNGSEMKLYVNGDLKGTKSFTGYQMNTSLPLRLGASNKASGEAEMFFNGAIDEVRIWNTALTQTDIQNNMHNVISPSATGLAAYYRFEHSGGNQLSDLAGSRNATLINTNESNWIDSYAMLSPLATGITEVAGNSFTLNWTAPTKGLTPTEYLLDVDDNSDFSSPVAGFNNLNVGNVTSYRIDGLPSGSIYYCRVSAFRDATIGQSIYSNAVSLDSPLPVELISFNNEVKRNNVELKWKTATETNNHGFEIERRINDKTITNSEWIKVGFVNGSGNSNSPKDYQFTDKNIKPGKYAYRLKQLDNDGKYTYLSELQTEVKYEIDNYSLMQNYPNPFNPSTTISYTLLSDSKVKLSVYNMLGQEVAILSQGIQQSGYYEAPWNAGELASGIYIYVLETSSLDGKGNFKAVQKMLLLK